ncbi:hypothetical protein [Halosimplex sp. TS25]|uniref:hypothetical protein n=1 Tax=Halosimplex rarum TaxID=3396619 RepID=UPI0039EC2533
MAVSNYDGNSWHQEFTIYWSQLYALYAHEIIWQDQLCDHGYRGYPDPQYETDDGELNPDLTGFHEEGDAHHIAIRCFEDIKDGGNKYVEGHEDSVTDEIESLSKYHDIASEEVSDWLSFRDHDFEPNNQEVVALIPRALYAKYSSVIDSAASENDIIVWTIRPNGSSIIEKQCGNHSNRRLERAVSDELKTYPNATDLLQFSRRTDTEFLKFVFVRKLVNHCSRENKLEFTFDEVDTIMTESQPPVLGHLRRETREEEFWRDFLYSMLRRFKIIEKGNDESTYRWKRKNFINEPRYQSRILENVREDLGIGENA